MGVAGGVGVVWRTGVSGVSCRSFGDSFLYICYNGSFGGTSFAVLRLGLGSLLRWGRRGRRRRRLRQGPLAWFRFGAELRFLAGDVGLGEEGRTFLESNVEKMSGPVPAALPSRDVFGAPSGYVGPLFSVVGAVMGGGGRVLMLDRC